MDAGVEAVGTGGWLGRGLGTAGYRRRRGGSDAAVPPAPSGPLRRPVPPGLDAGERFRVGHGAIVEPAAEVLVRPRRRRVELHAQAAKALALLLPSQHLGQVRVRVLCAAVLSEPPAEWLVVGRRHHGGGLVLRRVVRRERVHRARPAAAAAAPVARPPPGVGDRPGRRCCERPRCWEPPPGEPPPPGVLRPPPLTPPARPPPLGPGSPAPTSPDPRTLLQV